MANLRLGLSCMDLVFRLEPAASPASLMEVVFGVFQPGVECFLFGAELAYHRHGPVGGERLAVPVVQMDDVGSVEAPFALVLDYHHHALIVQLVTAGAPVFGAAAERILDHAARSAALLRE